MAPWPDQGNEPKAPDKICTKGAESNNQESSKVDAEPQEDHEVKPALGKSDDKQDEKNSGVSELDDGQLRALLDEAITYKCPKDREGKSNLFRELLEEVEAESDGGEKSNPPPPFGIVDQCRSGKRRRRDAGISERQTRGGSLQNIVQAYSDFESAYSGNRGKKSFGGGRRKDLGHYGVGSGGTGRASGSGSVSARQREGGSLPCNVNVGSVGGGIGGGQSLHNPASECSFEGVVHRRRSDQRVSWELDNNEDVMPAHMDRGVGGGPVAAPPPADVATGRSEAGMDLVGDIEKEVGRSSVSDCESRALDTTEGVANGVVENVSATNRCVAEGANVDNRMMDDDISHVELGSQLCASLLSSTTEDRTGDEVELQLLQVSEDRNGRSKFKDDGHINPTPGDPEVPELVAEPSVTVSPVPARSLSSVAATPAMDDHKSQREVVQGDSVDNVVPFPLQSEEKKPLVSASSAMTAVDLTKGLVNGMETAPLQLPSSYASVKSLVGSSSISCEGPCAASSSHRVAYTDNQTVIQSGILEERSVLSMIGKDGAVMKKQQGEREGQQPKPIVPIQGTYSMSIPSHHLSVLTYPPNNWIGPSESRLSFHSGKDLNEIKSKSLDENGNAVSVSQGLNKDLHDKAKGKPRRPKTQDEGYWSQSIEGFRGDQDLDCLLKFIGTGEEKKSKNSNSGPVERVRRSNIRRDCDRGVGSELATGRMKTSRDKNGLLEDREELNGCGLGSNDKNPPGSKMGPRSAGGGRQNQIQQRSGKMKKSNSLEEISKTKSEDLTLPASYTVIREKKEIMQSLSSSCSNESYIDRSLKNEDMGINNNEKIFKDDNNGNLDIITRPAIVSAACKLPISATSFKEDFYAVTDANPQVLEETEFHVVTKKQRRKKRKGGSGDGGGPADGRGMNHYQDNYSYGGGGGVGDRSDDFRRGGEHMEGPGPMEDNEGNVWGGGGGGGPGEPRFCSYRRHHRRHRSQRSGDRLKSTSSVPPSEHSGESSDDSDSVHSLPVSSSVPHPPVDPSSTSSGSTPQASYADIARMAFAAIPVVAGNTGNVPIGNPIPPPPPPAAQKSKNLVVAIPSVQSASFPPMSANPSGLTSHVLSAKLSSCATHTNGLKTASCSVVPLGEAHNPSGGSTNKSISQSVSFEDHESAQDAEVITPTCASVSPQVIEPRKKDAMTCTTLDGKTVTNSCTVGGLPSQPKLEVEMASHSSSPSIPNILEDYYPSLQESLHEKTERRNGKSSQHQLLTSKVNPGEDKRNSKITAPSPSVPLVQENKVSEAETPTSCAVSVASSVEKTGLPTTSEVQPSTVPPKVREASVASMRIKASAKKPGFRSLPPVVIMDHHYRQDGSSKDGSNAVGNNCSEFGSISDRNCTSAADIGGFTFGFEVNEELLALSSGVAATTSESPCREKEEAKKSIGESTVVKENSEVLLPAVSPVAIESPLGGEKEEAIPVYCSPGEIDTNKFNYEKIVSFIGSSWEDVLKEMGVPAIKPTSNRVQYYNGGQ